MSASYEAHDLYIELARASSCEEVDNARPFPLMGTRDGRSPPATGEGEVVDDRIVSLHPQL